MGQSAGQEKSALDELMECIEKYKKNIQCIPPENIAKYENAFASLKKKMTTLVNTIFWEIVQTNWYIKEKEELGKKFDKHFENLMAKFNKSGGFKKINDALFKFCNIDLAMSYIFFFRAEVEKGYVDYWLSHTTKIAGTFYYNDLIDMVRGEEDKLWHRKDGEAVTVALYWPPTKEGFIKQIKEELAGHLDYIKKHSTDDFVVKFEGTKNVA